MEYITEPKTVEDYLNNVEFQLSNVHGFLSINDKESALVKAKCLHRATSKLVEMLIVGHVPEHRNHEPAKQICYKTNKPCEYNCQGLCRESF